MRTKPQTAAKWMKNFVFLLFYVVITLFITLTGLSAQEYLISEDFNTPGDLALWEPLLFENIKEHTSYSIVKEGEAGYLKIESEKSASGLIYQKEFDVNDYPVVTWRWKAENILSKGDAARKEGDDYPVRVYIIFEVDLDRLSFGDRIAYETAKLFYGEYPPHASLNYIFANKKQNRRIIPNPFTNRAMMFVMNTGAGETGNWYTHTINILDDYREAFNEDPPENATLAVMGDSDNTKGAAVAYIDYIRVGR